MSSPTLPLSGTFRTQVKTAIRSLIAHFSNFFVTKEKNRKISLDEHIGDVTAHILHALVDAPEGTFIRVSEAELVESHAGVMQKGTFSDWRIDLKMSAEWANEYISSIVELHLKVNLHKNPHATVEFSIVKGEGPGRIQIVQEKGN